MDEKEGGASATSPRSDGKSRRLRRCRRRRRLRVNVVVLGAMCIRILFTDGYEIDILGDPTREAHGTNKRHDIVAVSLVQISASTFCCGVCYAAECESLPIAKLLNREESTRKMLIDALIRR